MTKTPSSRSRRPTRGRATATDDIIEAAARLFAERSPTSVSLRDVAEAADVNTGLIHHYIGNKRDLITAVLGREASRDYAEMTDAELIDAMTQFLVAGDPDDPETIHLIGNVRAALAGIDLTGEGVRFPLTKVLYERAAQHTDPNDAQVRAVFILSAIAGWLVLGRPALAAVGAPTPTAERVAPALASLFTQVLLDGPAPPS